MKADGSVYALCTPAGRPFYVGATVQSPGTRAGQHLRDARCGRRGSRLHELLAQTGVAGIWVLEAGIACSDLGKRERYHKKFLERSGFTMLNYHHGANGCNFQSDGARQHIAAYAAKRSRSVTGQFLPTLLSEPGG